MKTKMLALLMVCVFLQKTSFSQSKLPDPYSCAEVFKDVSYFWKLDSLGSNGARYFSYQKILDCKCDTLTVRFVKANLGKANKMRRTTDGIEYIYYYLDFKAMPKNYSGPYACFYISFMFTKTEDKLIKIFDGDFEY
jgi:hypothetical protein